MVKLFSRRQFIRQHFQYGSLVLGILFTECQSKERPSQTEGVVPQTDTCDDLSGLSAEELKPRTTFGYVHESPIEGNQCSNCKLWLPGKPEDPCGKCLLFKGPVYATGYCTYWAPQSG